MSATNGPTPGERILGIDPGLQITGYAVVEVAAPARIVCEAGVIRSAEGRDTTDMARRVLALYNGIVEVIDQYRPNVMVVEQLYAHYEHPRTAILMAHARGVIFLAAAQRGHAGGQLQRHAIKKTITGNGRASKEQVQRTIHARAGPGAAAGAAGRGRRAGGGAVPLLRAAGCRPEERPMITKITGLLNRVLDEEVRLQVGAVRIPGAGAGLRPPAAARARSARKSRCTPATTSTATRCRAGSCRG